MDQASGIDVSGTGDELDPPDSTPGSQGTEVPDDKPPEQDGAAGGADNETGLKEEKDELLVLQEGLTIREKPPREMLDLVRDKNARGLQQDFNLLGPGTRLYLKWPDRFKKRVPVPYNTPWVELLLVKECAVSQGSRKIWNWSHPIRSELTGNLELGHDEAWEIMAPIATREENKCRAERNTNIHHRMNKLKAPVVSSKYLEADALQPEKGANGTSEFDEYLENHPEVFKSYEYNDSENCQFGQNPNLDIINVSAESRNYQPHTPPQPLTVPPPQPPAQPVTVPPAQPLTDAGPPPPPTAPSSVGMSITSTRLGEFMSEIDVVIKQGIFNLILEEITIVSPEVERLLKIEKVALKMVHNVDRAITTGRTPVTIKPLWRKLYII